MKLSLAQLREYAKKHPGLAASVEGLTALLEAAPASSPHSPGEEALAASLRDAGLIFEREYRFDPARRWRFDFALLAHALAVEVEGGLWGGRHTRPGGYAADMRKYNRAAELGWTVLRFTTEEATNGEACRYILALVALKEAR